MKALELNGKRFGKLVVKERMNLKKGASHWNCQCDCGNFTILTGARLTSGNTKSCGCFRSESAKLTITKHGYSGTKEYRAWRHMKNRCTNENDEKYKYYGGRGITVCDRWLNSFENFLDDMGLCSDPKFSLDRIKVEGNYEKENCRWASSKTQANNKTTTNLIDLEDGFGIMSFTQQAERLGISRDTVKMRLLYGWDLKEAFYGERRINQYG